MGNTECPRPQIKGLWPVRFLPFDDELITSWLHRLAWANGRKLQRFLFELFPSRQHQLLTLDLDWEMPSYLLDRLAMSLGVSESLIDRHTLKSVFSECLFASDYRPINKYWLLPSKTAKNLKIGSYVMLCPDCLQEDSTPYIRKHWRYSWDFLCTKHNKYLIDQCPVCNALFDYRACDAGEKEDQVLFESSIVKCKSCKNIVDDKLLVRCNASAVEYCIQNFISTGFRLGKVGSQESWAYAQPFFSSVREMASCLFHKTELRAVVHEILSELGYDPEVREQFVTGRMFNAHNVSVRRMIINCIVYVLRKFPENLISISKRHSITSSPWIGHESEYIYAIRNAINSLDRSWYKVSDVEYTSVRKYLMSKGFPCTEINIKRWLGRYYYDHKFIQHYRELDKFNF